MVSAQRWPWGPLTERPLQLAPWLGPRTSRLDTVPDLCCGPTQTRHKQPTGLLTAALLGLELETVSRQDPAPQDPREKAGAGLHGACPVQTACQD